MTVGYPQGQEPRKRYSNEWYVNQSGVLLNDYFFGTAPVGSNISVKVGGSFVSVITKVKVSGSFVSATKKIKSSGVFA